MLPTPTNILLAPYNYRWVLISESSYFKCSILNLWGLLDLWFDPGYPNGIFLYSHMVGLIFLRMVHVRVDLTTSFQIFFRPGWTVPGSVPGPSPHHKLSQGKRLYNILWWYCLFPLISCRTWNFLSLERRFAPIFLISKRLHSSRVLTYSNWILWVNIIFPFT